MSEQCAQSGKVDFFTEKTTQRGNCYECKPTVWAMAMVVLVLVLVHIGMKTWFGTKLSVYTNVMCLKLAKNQQTVIGKFQNVET